MWSLNHFLSLLFDSLLGPFEAWPPFWLLVFVALPTGILMLLIFRCTSNQAAIRETKDRIKAHLLEIRLFRDDLSALLSAQKNLLRYNFKYFGYAVKPMLIMVIPVAILILQLNGWFAYRPVNIGESFILKVKFGNPSKVPFPEIALKADGGLSVETAPIRILSEREWNWRLRAIAPGEHTITVKADQQTFHKRINVANERLARITPVVSKSGVFDIILNSTEVPLIDTSPISRIEIDYPARSIQVFGWQTHWLVVFFIFSILFGFAFKGVLGVEL